MYGVVSELAANNGSISGEVKNLSVKLTYNPRLLAEVLRYFELRAVQRREFPSPTRSCSRHRRRLS